MGTLIIIDIVPLQFNKPCKNGAIFCIDLAIGTRKIASLTTTKTNTEYLIKKKKREEVELSGRTQLAIFACHHYVYFVIIHKIICCQQTLHTS